MKKGFKNNSTFKLAYSAVTAALSLALMVTASFIPSGSYALPCLAGIVLVSVVVEYGLKRAVCVYTVVALLSLLISGDKEAAVFFIMLFGYYPLLKEFIEERLRSRLLQWILKFAVFNAAVICAFLICSFVIGISPEEYSIGGIYVPWLFLLAGNAVFLLYDRAIKLMTDFYIQRLRNKLFK